MIDVVSWLENKEVANGVLIILNQPITNLELFDKAWNSCKKRVVTDGAANRLKELNNDKYIPDLIVGDFDSIEKASVEYYKQLGVEFFQDEDKYSTDFMKSMANSHRLFDKTPTPRTFLAFGALGGRVDHTWHSYLCLSLAHQKGDQLVLISDENITILLGEGEHDISTPRSVLDISCGYVPVNGDAIVATKGFEWDVADFKVSFESMLSTSNHLMSDQVWIKTNKPIMFTLEIRT